MKFLVDAQLPRKFALEIANLGADAIHTLDLPSANRTTDEEICKLALQTDRVVVTKDSDFVDSFLLRRIPAKLLFITTGNIPNKDLLQLLRDNWSVLFSMLEEGDFVELSRRTVTLHQ